MDTILVTKFKLNHLHKLSNTSLIYVWKLFGLELGVLVTSAKRTCREILLNIFGKSLTYIKKEQRSKNISHSRFRISRGMPREILCQPEVAILWRTPETISTL
jgi:hypothetical protein